MRSIQLILVLFALIIVNCSDHNADYASELNSEAGPDQQMYVIEREIPDAGSLSEEELKTISLASCDVIDQIGEDKLRWLHSYVTSDKVYCIYLANDPEYILEHAEKGGFPANVVTSVATVIGPGTSE